MYLSIYLFTYLSIRGDFSDLSIYLSIHLFSLCKCAVTLRKLVHLMISKRWSVGPPDNLVEFYMCDPSTIHIRPG